MNSLIVQVGLSVLAIGGILFLLVLLLKNIFAPKKIVTLKNYIKAENYKSAMNLAKEILSKEKTNIEAHYYLGEAYYNLQKYELALIEYKAAEKSGLYHNINERNLREHLAELYKRMDNLDEAIKEYILLSKTYPQDNIYLFNIGEIFELKGTPQQALKYYNESIKLNKNYVPALLNMGILLFDNKNYVEASTLFKRVIHLDPENYKCYFYLGLLEKSENNFKGAIKFFDKAMYDKDLRIRCLTEKGTILMSQNKYDEAAIELDRALNSCEEDNNIKNNIRYVLASCYEQKRNITEAITLWEQIYARKPDFKDIADKLSNYQDLRMDDRMKDFMTATNEDFNDMCRKIIFSMGLNIIEEYSVSKDSLEFLCLEPENKWRNMKKRPKLIQITRKNNPIEEAVLRDFNERMRNKAVIRGVIICPTIYSKLSIAFAKERPIELIDKNGLQELLKNTV